MRKTAEVLSRLGVQVEESFERRPNFHGFEIAHFFNLRTIHITPMQVRAAKNYGIPVVMSPIYLNPSRALWGTRVIHSVFRRDRTRADYDRLLADFALNKSTITRSSGPDLEADRQNRSGPTYDKVQKETLDQVDHLLPNSLLEIDQLVKTLGCCDTPFTIVPYAADAGDFLDPDPGLFIDKYGVRDFVLQVGRIELSKNQLLMLYAVRDLGLPVVLIGGQLNKNYVKWCKQFGPRDLRIIPHLPTNELRSAYAAARVHVLPSWIETCGLVTMEAALANCNIVVSTAGYEIEYYRNYAYYCNPNDVGSIRNAVQKAYDNYARDADRRRQLKEIILNEYTWERAATITKDAYVKVLKASPGEANNSVPPTSICNGLRPKKITSREMEQGVAAPGQRPTEPFACE